MRKSIHLKRPSGKLFELATEVVTLMRKASLPTYWVGGAVRDIFLGRMPVDVDIVTAGRPEEVKAVFPDAEMVGACFGVVLVNYKNVQFEIASCREERSYCDGRHPGEIKFTDDFEVDMLRRDFTCNAMLYDPEREELIDFVNGIGDIKSGMLRVVGRAHERFAEDYLRMFRAVRFAAKLGLAMDDEIISAIRAMKDSTLLLAAERVHDELENMLCGTAPCKSLELLKSTGLLAVWLPEVDQLEGVEQCRLYHPEGDVWQHTLLMFANLPAPADKFLAWSILLHDIGKKPTQSFSEDGVPHFYCHESVGADMVKVVAERLRFSNTVANVVEHAVRNHMRFASVKEMRPAKLKRLMAEEFFAMELELHRLDCLSSNGLMDTWAFLQEKSRQQTETVLPEPLLNGHDLLRLGYSSGPQFKVILDAAMDAQLEGVFSDKSGAEAWLEENF